jgi:predicted O-methyltransferase YrrM
VSNRFPYIGAIPAEGVASPYYVMLALPIAEKPCTATMVSLAATAQALTLANVRFDIETLTGCCHVDDARNILIRHFLQSHCSHLFFIDADLGWQPNNVLRLLKLPGDIVAGVYCHKSDGESYPFHGFEGETRANEWGLFPMPKAATGFMRIRRQVLEELYEREKAKDRLMWLDGDSAQLNRLPVARICERGFVRELGLEEYSRTQASQSGDYVLCLKARSLGFEVLIDPDMEFNHSGEKTWHGHFGNHTRREQRIDPQRFIEAIEEISEFEKPPVESFDKLVSSSLHGPRAALPGQALAACHEMARTARGPILECGSGLSTLVMGLAARGTGRLIYSLENDIEWLRRVGVWCDRYGLYNVRLVFSPLIPTDEKDPMSPTWYGVVPSQLPAKFDGVLIDGPPRSGVNRLAVFDVLHDAIKDARTWIIDDIDNPEDLEQVTGRNNMMITAESAGFRHDTVISTPAKAQREAAE